MQTATGHLITPTALPGAVQQDLNPGLAGYPNFAADEAVRRVIACPGLDFAGLHSHIGSQIFDAAGFEVAAHRVIELAARIRDEHGIEIAELDLGGGFGIAYTEEDDAPEVKDLAQSLRQIVDGQCAAAGGIGSYG